MKATLSCRPLNSLFNTVKLLSGNSSSRREKGKKTAGTKVRQFLSDIRQGISFFHFEKLHRRSIQVSLKYSCFLIRLIDAHFQFQELAVFDIGGDPVGDRFELGINRCGTGFCRCIGNRVKDQVG